MHCSQKNSYKFCNEPDVTITNKKARESHNQIMGFDVIKGRKSSLIGKNNYFCAPTVGKLLNNLSLKKRKKKYLKSTSFENYLN